MPGIRVLTDIKKSLFLLVFTGLSVLLLQAGDMPAFSYLMIGLLLFPLMMLLSSAVGGLLPAACTLGIILLGAIRVYGTAGLWYLLYLLPMTVVFLYCINRGLPFHKTVFAVFAAYLLSIVAMFLLFQRATGGDLFGYIAKATIDGLEGMPQRDPLLYTFWRYGFLSHGMEAGTQVFDPAPSGWTFKPEVLSEFYKQISLRVTSLAAGFVPGLMTTFAVTLSALGTGFSLYLARRQADIAQLAMPPFSQWHIPRKWGTRLWVLALGYLLALFTQNPVLSLTGQMMYNVFFSLYAIQGLAVLDYRMKARNWRPMLRMIALLLLLLTLAIIPVLIGIMDQANDTRRLRPKKPDQQHL